MQSVDSQFFSSLFPNPAKSAPSVLTEMRQALGSENQGIARAAQMISELHGPYNGSSPVLHQFLQKQSDGIKNIDTNQKSLDSYNKRIMENLTKIDQARDRMLASTEDQTTFLDAANDLLYYVENTGSIFSEQKFIDVLAQLQDLLPHKVKSAKTIYKEIQTALELISNIISSVNKNNINIVDIMKGFSSFSFKMDQLIESITDAIDSKATNSYLASLKKQEKTYSDMAKKSEKAIDELTYKMENTKSIINRVNDTAAALFDTPLLKEFVSGAMNLHPAISSIIQQNLSKFPYFQQISERVGSFYTITSSISSIDPMKWLKNDAHDFMTNNILRGQQQSKLFGGISNLITNSDGLLNTMLVRSMPKTAMGLVHQAYGAGEAIAHGFSGAMDSFHAIRALSAKAAILPQLLNTLQDKIRLLDSYFPVVQAIQTANQYFTVPIESGQFLVNIFNRIADKTPMIIENMAGAKTEHFNGGRDNETSQDSDTGQFEAVGQLAPKKEAKTQLTTADPFRTFNDKVNSGLENNGVVPSESNSAMA